MKKLKRIRILLLLAAFLCLQGCQLKRVEQTPKENIEYTVVKEEDIPEELKRIIEEKKKDGFRMTYKNQEYLYLLRGYGRQLSGGYSIRIDTLAWSEEAILFKTSLIGPQKGEKQIRVPSYPYIVVKMPYQKAPVLFQ